MQQLLERQRGGEGLAADGELAARAQLRAQIGRLEREHGRLFAEAFPFVELDPGSPVAPDALREPGAPRVLDLGELERSRDRLAGRIAEARAAIAARRELEGLNRGRLTALIEAPAHFPGLSISRAEVGEPGCGGWTSVPRFGPLGRLLGWWRVKVSSGCPLAGRLAAVEREGPPPRRPAPA